MKKIDTVFVPFTLARIITVFAGQGEQNITADRAESEPNALYPLY
jgi:hypothetical protein